MPKINVNENINGLLITQIFHVRYYDTIGFSTLGLFHLKVCGCGEGGGGGRNGRFFEGGGGGGRC